MEALLAQFKNSMPEPLWNFLVLLAALATAVWTVVRSFVFVQPGRVGIRKRFGKPILKYSKKDASGRPYTKEEIAQFKAEDEEQTKKYRPALHGRPHDLHPGFNALIPFVHSVEIMDVRLNNIRLGAQRIADLASYVAYDLTGISVNIFLNDVYLWLIASIDAEEQVKATADTALSSILLEFSHEQVLSNDPMIEARFIELTADELSKLGVILEVGALKLGSMPMNVKSTFHANSQREMANAQREIAKALRQSKHS